MEMWRKRQSGENRTQLKRSKQGLPKQILPKFEPSGLLELESNSKEGVLLKHVEPSDARCPKDFWAKNRVPLKNRHIFQAVLYRKGEEVPMRTYDLELKSSYIIGRGVGRSWDDSEEKEVVVADIVIPEETCSKQHCAIQFREVRGRLAAYVIDLESSNGTNLNGVRLPAARYVELRSGDIINPSAVADDESDYDIVFVNANFQSM
ncbi:hypothetical protein HG536_0E03970 [Torulaspora globosa]|uniref:FHA domain-containing protein n=1 Tax=Torulaspora globosa TaxID=48254 RepID=A0A7G3ZJ00_9SACH|nr:uncharacterized protein HG536_0E03970 [Torulaspora globosa]QLL33486.1 hypothetical protein HG536_0E03970 [Torulaspora globosa]